MIAAAHQRASGALGNRVNPLRLETLSMSVHLRHRFHPSSPAVRDKAVERHLVECRNEFLRYFRRRLARPEDAEDAVQDFSLKVIRAADTLQDGEKINAWLGRILRNTLTDHYRRRATRQRAEADYALEPREDAVDQEPQTTLCACIHEVLPALNPGYAEIIRRADLEEAPREEIASELGITVNNVGVRLHRARRALKIKLTKRCGSCCDGGFQTCGCADAGGSRGV
ncbi:sigma-70 family RNA polymerase sigma factor [uncultured Jannaschia sp.]|uniref:RNA polymerase sigma factor n=1 Tax=uncultured Jannaschia sp. TaxID=293347 RepID=UPI00261EB0BF|nr:sigma-70 family RNA polymerase sigma factor [uncultured Jannaschia sp.]